MSNIFEYELPELDSEFFKTELKDKNVEIKTIISNTLKTPQTSYRSVMNGWWYSKGVQR